MMVCVESRVRTRDLTLLSSVLSQDHKNPEKVTNPAQESDRSNTVVMDVGATENTPTTGTPTEGLKNDDDMIGGLNDEENNEVSLVLVSVSRGWDLAFERGIPPANATMSKFFQSNPLELSTDHLSNEFQKCHHEFEATIFNGHK
jgi:hypothetical protein